jgi:hypothetical protein
MTKLERFLETNRIKPAHLAVKAAVSRKQLLAARKGEANMTLRFMRKVATGVSRLAKRPVTVDQLFDVNGKEKAS